MGVYARKCASRACTWAHDTKSKPSHAHVHACGA